jgi:hypothetical protein
VSFKRPLSENEKPWPLVFGIRCIRSDGDHVTHGVNAVCVGHVNSLILYICWPQFQESNPTLPATQRAAPTEMAEIGANEAGTKLIAGSDA